MPANYLHYRLSGELTRPGCARAGQAIIARSRETGCPKVLVDLRHASGNLELFDMYKLASDFAEAVKGYLQVAMIELQPRIRPDRFFETATRNRGIDLQLFTNKNEALKWLQVEEAAEDDKLEIDCGPEKKSNNGDSAQ